MEGTMKAWANPKDWDGQESFQSQTKFAICIRLPSTQEGGGVNRGEHSDNAMSLKSCTIDPSTVMLTVSGLFWTFERNE